MRRSVILLLGVIIWLTGGVLLAQNIAWDKLVSFFHYQDSLRVGLDAPYLERLENWEEPDLLQLPQHLREDLIRPYFMATHPGQQQEADWMASSLYQDELYSYAYKDLKEGGHAMVLLGQGNHGPYLLLLTYNKQNEFLDALTLYADYARQGMEDQTRSTWLKDEVLQVRVSSTWEDQALRQIRTDNTQYEYHIQADGRVVELPPMSKRGPNR